jgi:hypothetical protein
MTTLNFEQDLTELLGERMREDSAFACRVYGSLGNVEWQHAQATYSCSFRYAGELIAEMRDQGEDYLDFYCSSPAGVVDSDVRAALGARGWTPETDFDARRGDDWKPEAL